MLAVPVAAALSLLVAPAIADAAVTPTGVTDTIHIVLVKGKLKFEAPSSVTQGDELEIVNDTNPKQVGPHTFSLVTKGSLPKTPPARKSCFTPTHICLSIAKWQGAHGEEPPSINPSEAGPEGWSTMGTIAKTGDSWFTQKKGSSLTQVVSANAGTLYFMCAVHPWMQGKIQVKAPTVGVPGV
ncbi:MAG: hypothetical protein H0X42_01760 [Solirubrobacterales bacterium]|nr:hypothetical protein [Solirubrobacterales bacterium]